MRRRNMSIKSLQGRRLYIYMSFVRKIINDECITVHDDLWAFIHSQYIDEIYRHRATLCR